MKESNLKSCEICGKLIGQRRPHAKYCKSCARALRDAASGKSRYKAAQDIDVEWLEILEFCKA
jgi:RNA polymerase-binding transcription factor DksA